MEPISRSPFRRRGQRMSRDPSGRDVSNLITQRLPTAEYRFSPDLYIVHENKVFDLVHLFERRCFPHGIHRAHLRTLRPQAILVSIRSPKNVADEAKAQEKNTAIGTALFNPLARGVDNLCSADGELVGLELPAITLWLLVRVRPAPPRSRAFLEISRLGAGSCASNDCCMSFLSRCSSMMSVGVLYYE